MKQRRDRVELAWGSVSVLLHGYVLARSREEAETLARHETVDKMAVGTVRVLVLGTPRKHIGDVAESLTVEED